MDLAEMVRRISRYVRAVGLVDGGLYRPRRARSRARRGRHRMAEVSMVARLGVTLMSLFGGDVWAQIGFFGLVLLGTPTTILGMVLVAVGKNGGAAPFIVGLVLLFLAGGLLGFFYLEPNLPPRRIVYVDRTQDAGNSLVETPADSGRSEMEQLGSSSAS